MDESKGQVNYSILCPEVPFVISEESSNLIIGCLS
jgi:hypothetical protein